jgi:predicted O-methyltransferase YrrM
VHAGVDDRVHCVVGTLGDGGLTFDTLTNERGVDAEKVDLLFIDHDKGAYLPDLQSILDHRWLHRGSIVVADNMLIPGSPRYREFMTQQQGNSSTPSSTRHTASIRRWCPMSSWSRNFSASRSRSSWRAAATACRRSGSKPAAP